MFRGPRCLHEPANLRLQDLRVTEASRAVARGCCRQSGARLQRLHCHRPVDTSADKLFDRAEDSSILRTTQQQHSSRAVNIARCACSVEACWCRGLCWLAQLLSLQAALFLLLNMGLVNLTGVSSDVDLGCCSLLQLFDAHKSPLSLVWSTLHACMHGACIWRGTAAVEG